MIEPSRLAKHLSEPADTLVIGITGRTGRRHALLMRAYGTRIVGGTSTQEGVTEIDGTPVFPSISEAVAVTGARVAIAFVPAAGILDIVRAAVAGHLHLLVTVAEGMPVGDAALARGIARKAGLIWIGPSTPGFAIPGQTKVGFLPDVCLSPGPVGVVAKSGTLSYEACLRLKAAGFGQSLWVGVGGEMIKGLRFADLVTFFSDDPQTRALVVIGEIGGTEEEELAARLKETGFSKPCLALIAGSSAPEGKTMGHAGALAYGQHGTFEAKANALSAAGAEVVTSLSQLVERAKHKLI